MTSDVRNGGVPRTRATDRASSDVVAAGRGRAGGLGWDSSAGEMAEGEGPRDVPQVRDAARWPDAPTRWTSPRAPAAPRTPEEKARARGDRARKYEAMKQGEAWALNPRDRGPAKALARDYIDSKRRISEYYMYILVVLLAAVFLRNKTEQQYVSPLVLVLVVVILLDAQIIRRSLRRLVAERLPGESTRGLTVYAVMRALQIRRFRMPAPRVRPGDKF